MKLIKLFLSVFVASCFAADLDPEWTKKFHCGEGMSCAGLDPPADGCYYNNKKKKGFCYHNFEGMGYKYFKGRDENAKSKLRFLGGSTCTTQICNTCVRSCYDPNCTDPTSCSWCTCFPGTWYDPFLTQPSCCPLPAPGLGLD